MPVGLLRHSGSIWSGLSSGEANEPEVDTYIDGLTTSLSSGQISLLNTFVKEVKSGLGIGSLSDAFDVMYILANETAESSLRNLVKRAHDATAVNSPVFTALEGFTGDGTAAYLNSNYNPNAQSVKYTQNNASLILYSRTDIKVDALHYDFGVRDDVNGWSVIGLGANNGDGTRIRINDLTNIDDTNRADGFFVSQRTASNARAFYRNNTLLKSDSALSTGLPNYNLYMCAINNEGVAKYHTTNQLSLAAAGKSFTETERQVIQDAFQKYMTANGKEV